MDPIQYKLFFTELKNKIPSILGDDDYAEYEGNWICEKCGKTNAISRIDCGECHEKNDVLKSYLK